jgi:hypothetical protein
VVAGEEGWRGGGGEMKKMKILKMKKKVIKICGINCFTDKINIYGINNIKKNCQGYNLDDDRGEF